MPSMCRPEEWRPIGIADLEDAAWATVRDTTGHQVVLAGPGAGKTELLAQRAAYLLQTGAVTGERRILALAFKRDAAGNLAERVNRRCGQELGRRFTSLTIDAFARGLIDRFGIALPPDRRPPTAYDVVDDQNTEWLAAMRRGVREAVDATAGSPHAATAVLAQRYIGDNKFVARLGAAREAWSPYRSRLSLSQDEETAAARWATPHAWRSALNAGLLSWSMLKRMAICLVAECAAVRRALRQTYAHLFLDEVQDLTRLQFELVYTCFPPGTAQLTAVGDERQAIMAWAGAVPDICGHLTRRYGAVRRELVLNHRAGGRLVAMQRELMRDLAGTAPDPRVANAARDNHGRCAIWSFADDAQEAVAIARCVQSLLTRGVLGHEICLLTRQKVALFAPALEGTLAELGIPARVEHDYQEVARDACARACRALLALAVRGRAPEEFEHLVRLVERAARIGRPVRTANASSDATEHVRVVARRLERRLTTSPTEAVNLREMIRDSLDELLGGSHALAGAVSPPQTAREADCAIDAAIDLFATCRAQTATWREALDRYDGVGVVPIMTVHKSKGLEYDTVVFVGLDDQEWWNFRGQPEEEQRTFFVAFSRAKERVLFTFSHARDRGRSRPERRTRANIEGLYGMLTRAGVEIFEEPQDEAHEGFVAPPENVQPVLSGRP